MSELTRLLPVSPRNIGTKTLNAIDGRTLHNFLEVGKVFAAWMPEHIEAFGFIEHQDFETCFPDSESKIHGGHNRKEYLISIPMAKELAMVQRTAKGKEARLYFIECERRALEGPQWEIPKTYAGALALAAQQAEELDRQAEAIAILEPKAAFCDQVARAEDTHTMAEAAKILGTGRVRLFQWLREHHYLYLEGRDHLPYQNHMDAGLFKLVIEPFEDAHGRDRCYSKVLVTGKGIVALQRKLGGSNPVPLLRSQHKGGRTL
jgi:anti-repressor protein